MGLVLTDAPPCVVSVEQRFGQQRSDVGISGRVVHERALPALRQIGARLMDAVDPGLVDQAQAALLEVPGVHSVADLKLRWIGHTLRAEAAVTVDPALSVTAGHDLAHLAESQLQSRIPRLAAVSVHIGPARV